jgi:hypothetical protein
MIWCERLCKVTKKHPWQIAFKKMYILTTPFAVDPDPEIDAERYREWFYNNIDNNPEFKEEADNLVKLHIKYGRLELLSNTSCERGWISIIKEYVFNGLREYAKKQRANDI